MDPPSEDEIVRLRERLMQATRRICPRWLEGQLEDVVQAAWIKTVELVRRGETSPSPPTSYLRKVAYTVLLDEIRRSDRRGEVPLLDRDAADAQSGKDPEQACAAGLLGEAIETCLQGMVAARRQAVALHLMGHSGPEASSILGWSAKRVSNLVYRGLADLRRCLEAGGWRP
jgi:RNA polymerase sigma-70 factor (ECF subfamily)